MSKWFGRRNREEEERKKRIAEKKSQDDTVRRNIFGLKSFAEKRK